MYRHSGDGSINSSCDLINILKKIFVVVGVLAVVGGGSSGGGSDG